MLIIMRQKATDAQKEAVKQFLIDLDCDFHQSTGANRTIIGVIGETARIDQGALKALPGVLEVVRIPPDEE